MSVGGEGISGPGIQGWFASTAGHSRRISDTIIVRYGIALLSVVAATLVRMVLDPLLAEEFPFVPYIVAIVFIAWYGGLGPSICTMTLGFFLTAYFFLTPRGSIQIGSLQSQVGALMYLVVGASTIWSTEAMHAAQRRANSNKQELLQKQEALESEIRERRDAQAAYVTLLRRVVVIQEQERSYISRELHDQCGQDLTALDLGLKLIERAVKNDDAAMRQLQSMHETLGRVSREVHNLALELRPPALDELGLCAAIKGFLESWSARTNVQVDFESRGLEGRDISVEVETAVYRIVLESLINVAKHAQADRVSVILEVKGDCLLAITEDQGVGFDLESQSSTAVAPRNLGLLGMRERIEAVGGELEIESAVGTGTTVFARVPLTGPTGGHRP